MGNLQLHLLTRLFQIVVNNRDQRRSDNIFRILRNKTYLEKGRMYNDITK